MSCFAVAALAPCSRSVPVLGNVKAISAGAQHTCAVLGDGAVVCWGSNSNGQLGAPGIRESPVPVRASGLDGARAVSAGQFHTCAVTGGGAVKCWGANAFGQLGNGGRSDSAVPVDAHGPADAVSVVAGWSHTCAVRAGGAVSCWGLNAAAQLGAPPDETLERCSGSTGEMPCSRVPVEVKGLVATGLSAGGDHTCAVLADAGVACWGSNTHSQLGIATGKGPDRCETAGFAHGCASVPRKVERLESAAAVAAGGYHTCVLGRDAQVRCWGPNLMGQLSTGRQKGSANPVAAQGLSAVASLSAGLMHNCALASDGTVRCWGSNKAGQLGAVTGRAADAGAYSDEKRSTLPFSVKGLSDVASVSCGAEHSCAVLKNGTAACWGSNEHGKLGDGTTRNSVEPVVVRAGAGLVR